MAESKRDDWLYNSPRPGKVAAWVDLNRENLQTYPVIDESVALVDYWRIMGPGNLGYRPDQVTMAKQGSQTNLLVPEMGSELWKIRDAYKLEQERIAADPTRSKELDANGSKLHLHRFTAWLTDRTSNHFEMFHYDWWGVRTLNMGLRAGKVPEHYRDNILPVLTGDHYRFQSQHPNWTTVHGVVLTADDHVILTKRVSGSDFHGDAVSVTAEEQMSGVLDNSPFDTFERMVDLNPKMRLANRGGEELRLHIRPGVIGLSAVILEPDVNGTGLIIIGQCNETSEEIDARILGRDKSEFDPKRPVWTLPLRDPDLAIQQLLDPPFLWHGSSRFRLLTALFALHGFEEITKRTTLRHEVLRK